MEIKRILKQYAFSLVVIICLTAFLCGITVVREKTRYNMDMTRYATITNEEDKLVIVTENDRIIIAENGKILPVKSFYEKIMNLLI